MRRHIGVAVGSSQVAAAEPVRKSAVPLAVRALAASVKVPVNGSVIVTGQE
jgi:hypothetical protein